MAGSPRTALVLAGGGAKGAFEAGAVTYLVEEEGIVPDVITATSAGAICAAVLAQARTRAEMTTRVREMHDDLLAMSHSELLFGKQPWVAALEGTVLGEVIDRWVVERTRPPVPGGPLPVAMAGHSGEPDRRRRALDLAARVVRALPHVGRAGRQLRGRTGSLLTLDPLADSLRRGNNGFAPVDPSLVARPGLDLRLAVVPLGAGVLRYVTGEGQIVAADATTVVPGAAGGPVDLLEAVLASASVPMVFPPRAMAGDVYVDGGVADNVPVAAAAALGATRIFAVLAVPLEQPPDLYDYATANGVTVFLRAVGGIAFAERQRANLSPPLPPGTTVTVIDPVVDVVGPFEVSQGLMLLDMDYGWMRAADVLADLDPVTRRVAEAGTDAVVTARTRAWHLEHAMWQAGEARPGDVAVLSDLKRRVRDALFERKALGLPIPAEAEQWWSGYERHSGRRPADLAPDPLAASGT